MEKPWLARYCQFPNLESQRYAWLKEQVHSLDGWSVATDAKLLLAWSDGGRMQWRAFSSDGFQTKDSVAEITAMRQLLTMPNSKTLRCHLGDLMAWCEYHQVDACDECNGEGHLIFARNRRGRARRRGGQMVVPVEVIEERHRCPECNGKAFDPAPGFMNVRPGILAGVLINRNYLCWALAPELLYYGEDQITVGVHPKESSYFVQFKKNTVAQMIVVDGSRFRLVIMGLDTEKHNDVYPTFHADPLYANLWQLRGNEEDSGILCDWLYDRDDPYHEVLREETRKKWHPTDAEILESIPF